MSHGNSRILLAAILQANFAAYQKRQGGDTSILVDAELLETKSMLDNGMRKLADHTLYSTKDVSGQRQIKLFETSDVESDGITNVTAAKLAKSQLFYATHIRVLAASSGAAINGQAQVLGNLSYTHIKDHGTLAGGTLTIRQNNKNVVYQLPMRMFDTTTRSNVSSGLYPLNSGILLRPQQLLEATIELGKAMPDKQAVRFELVGTQTIAS